MQRISRKRWAIIHTLAADLALNEVSKNLVQSVAEYFRHSPLVSLEEYLGRLESLGDYFTAGKSGHMERSELHRVISRVDNWPRDPEKIVLILSWIAQLIGYYENDREKAAEQSLLNFKSLRRGWRYKGVVRKRKGGTVWVAIGPGQWGRAHHRMGVDIGDEVEVDVITSNSPVDFRVDLVKVTKRITPPPPPPKPASEKREEVSIPPAADDHISKDAQSFLEFMKRKQAGEEE